MIKPLTLADLPMATDREAAWKVLQDHGPVVEMDGAYYVTSAAGIETMLHDPELFSSKLAFDALGSPVPLVPIAFDPPEHLRYRRMLAPFFSPGVISRLYDSLREQVATIIEPLAKAGCSDVVRELCVPFPAQVFLTLMGLPLEDTDRLVHWKTAVIAATTPGKSTSDDVTAALELFTYLTESIESRRGATDDSLWTQVVNDPSDEALSTDELVGLGFLLVLAGLDTVTSTLSIAFERLAGDPALQARLAGDASLIPEFVEELVRLDPVATFTPRVTSRETVLEGTLLPAGAHVVMVFGTANRETDERHWGFGGGVHRCLGSHLARAELRLVLEEWLKRIPEFSFSPGFTPVMEWPASLLGFDTVDLSYPAS